MLYLSCDTTGIYLSDTCPRWDKTDEQFRGYGDFFRITDKNAYPEINDGECFEVKITAERCSPNINFNKPIVIKLPKRRNVMKVTDASLMEKGYSWKNVSTKKKKIKKDGL